MSYTWTLTNSRMENSYAVYDLLLNGKPEINGMLYDEIYNHIFWHSKPDDIVSGDGPDSTVRTHWLHKRVIEARFNDELTGNEALALLKQPDDMIAQWLGDDFVATRK